MLALLFRVLFWPLNAQQFKSMMAMQKIAPKIKTLQAKYKNDQTKLAARDDGALQERRRQSARGCLPLLVQYPFIISVFYVVTQNKELYANQHFLWVGLWRSRRTFSGKSR